MESVNTPLSEVVVDTILATWKGTKPVPPRAPEPVFVLPSTRASESLVEAINEARSQGNVARATYLHARYTEVIAREYVAQQVNYAQYLRRMRQTGWTQYYKQLRMWYNGVERHYNALTAGADRSDVQHDEQIRRLDVYHFTAYQECFTIHKAITQDTLEAQVRSNH